jgi:hypothetical protein
MKKLLLLSAIAILAMTSCKKEYPKPEPVKPTPQRPTRYETIIVWVPGGLR